MKKSYLVLVALAAILLFLVPTNTRASHALGADIYYSCASTSNPNQYNVIVTFYRECCGGAISAPTSITLEYGSASCGLGPYTVTLSQSAACRTPDNQPGQGTQANTGTCNASLNQTCCSGGSLPGAQIYTYCGTITLPGQCPDWVLSYAECCRNNGVTNLTSAASYDQYVYALLNNTNSVCNNAPFFTSPATRTFCSGFPVNYNHGAVDVDGDSLVFSLIQPLDDAGAPVPYAGGLSVTNPLNTTSGFNFDPATGQMSFTPQGAQAAVITVLVEEYRNGVLIGSTMRDIQFKIVTSGCSPNNILPTSPTNISGGGLTTGPNGNPVVQVCPGVPLSFDLPYIDAGGNLMTVTNNVGQAIPGATTTCTTCTGTNDTATLRFTWTPTAADSGFHFFTVNYSNNACPISGGGVSTVQIFVYTEVSIVSPSNTYCGLPLQLEAIGGSVFQWSPPNGLSNPSISNPVATPSVPTFYTVTSDCGTDTITINIAQPFNFDAGPNQTICLNGLATLNTTTTGPGAPFSYQWSPSANAVANPQVSPAATTTYIATATASNGCVRVDSATVTVQGVAPNITAFASEDTVCPGGTVQLDLTASPTVCGPSTRACITNSVDYTIGNGTAFNSSSTGYPAIYGHFWESGKHQILYTAAELQALGLSGGTLTSIAFNIAQRNGTQVYYNFGVRIGCTSQNSITTFQSGLTTVINPRTININSTGWNSYTFDQTYDWDGVSNIVVEVCFDNSTALASFSNNSQHTYTTTPFTSVVFVNQDGSSVCGSTTVDGTSSDRPNARFGICQQGLAPGSTISWTPTANMTNPNTANPLVRVFNTTTFTVNVVEGACTGSDLVTVNVDNSLQLQAGPDTSICTPAPVTLTANAIGTASPISLTCGVNGTACGGASTNYTLGTAAQTTSVSTPYKGADEQARLQYLIRGNELGNLGLSAGIIAAISYNVTGKNTGAPFQAFTISIGCTNQDSLSVAGGFQAGLTQVFGPANVTTAAGWNTHTLTNGFDWDGFSNIIVEINFNNGFGATIGDDIVQATATSFGSSLFETYFFGAPSISLTRSNIRPDIRFSVCPPPPGQFVYRWTPSTGLTNPVTGLPTDTGQVVVANPGVTTSYVVEVTDGNCVAFDTVTIDFYSNFTANITISNVGCFGSNDGDIIAEPVGGYAPFTFVWTDAGGSVIRTTTGQNTDTLLALPAGTYYVELTDANGCMRMDTAVITVPPVLTITGIAGTNNSCFGQANGSAIATVTGGVAPYQYAWSNGGLADSNTQLLAGTYVLTVTDDVGCTAVDSIIITEPAPIAFDKDSVNVSCFGGNDGQAGITVTGGGTAPFTYAWSNFASTSTITGLAAGNYLVSVTDVNGCSFTASFNITQPAAMLINITNVVDASCANISDGSATADVNGATAGYGFAWSNGETGPVADSLGAGTNTVTVTDLTTNCTMTASVNITYPQQFALTTTATATSCYGGADGTAEVIISTAGGTPPYSYLWSDGQTTSVATGLTGGQTYFVTVTDASSTGCGEIDTILIPQPDSLIVTLTQVDVACNGAATGSINTTILGGTAPYTYAWSNGGNTANLNNLIAGLYEVTITDGGGCLTVTQTTITEPAPISFTEDSTLASCYQGTDGAASITITGGGTPPFTYAWTSNIGTSYPATSSIQNIPAGQYTVTATDGNGCSVSANYNITAPDSFIISVSNILDASCFNTADGSASASVAGGTAGYSFAWSNGETGPVADSLPVGSHVLTVTVDSSGCTQTTIVTIGSPARFTLTTTVTGAACYGGADGSATVTVSATGGTPPFAYQWSDGQQTPTAIQLDGGATYTITVTDNSVAGCSETATVTIPQPDSLTINLNVSNVKCFAGNDGSIRVDVVGGTGPYSYSWSNGGLGNLQDSLTVGNYSVTVTDNNGCSKAVNNVAITEPATLVTWDTTVVNVSCPDKNDGAIFVTATGGTPPYIFSLNNGNLTNADGNFLTLAEGLYNLEVIDANGCVSTGTVDVTAPNPFYLEFDPEFDTIQLGESYILTPILVPSVGQYSFSWQPANSLDCDTCQNPEASPVQSTVYDLVVYDENNCPRKAQFTLFVENQLLMYIPNAFSPNNDGINDKFQVYAPGASSVNMMIFNRWGEKVFDYSGDMSGGWDGQFKGQTAQIDVYIYYVEVIYEDGQKIAKEGSITIVK